MTVHFSPRALQDIEDIRAYLLSRNPLGAERVRRAVAEALDLCEANPKVGTATDEPRLYRWPLRKYRYTIFYQSLPAGDGIEVVRIVHGALVKNLGAVPDDL